MQSIQITLNTKEDAYNLAIKFGASELLAACIASECILPWRTLHIREYENPLSALIVECCMWGETELGFEFWDSLYESINQSINQS